MSLKSERKANNFLIRQVNKNKLMPSSCCLHASFSNTYVKLAMDYEEEAKEERKI